jgi:hypothetical protein
MAKVSLDSLLNGRPMADVSRSETRRFYASDTNVVLPSWFDFAKGMLLVSGCGGGGGSAGGDSITYGMAGGSGAFALKMPIIPPENAIQMRVLVGAAGAAGLAGNNGGNGGASYIQFVADGSAQTLIMLNGGGGGRAGFNGDSGTSALGGSAVVGGYYGFHPQPLGSSVASLTPEYLSKLISNAAGAMIPQIRAGRSGYRAAFSGASGGDFNDTTAYAAGTPFNPHGGTSGYGYGGKRADTTALGPGNAGGPGYWEIEFVEGF